ncbi:MerR family transcriptional regulator [Clostridium tyrobutyricum]|jgi:DNA-binding transcriptional MerR regulator/effector-binding domain-containing protein|uniref:MerR family transcriptional regulator n=2 Tax=Clostridium tyrobutyricum TaxID=1519 RepID=UPI00030F8A60|nr:MerR family transcriptional regulator [Clostridium tyrobutyricum]MBR9648103.1 MerR family transcriptional regulator [Clostridium tyrobutyricum]MBV4416854.1 MerR family transcriptional regulator [Clostridium tyrobutyricum]MBV4423609.1 MerR family transcriptional regulator [Clostridium tyrobutyricum]MBV4425713.1 MerR family transcriptional regulator [Clostridium tyrobutyricum]MBV4431439.1 MerR family transcriptional regulator [Clostridium tyrobutyricum]
MKDRISITDLARLRNVTTETLRYYDRIGLFKPIYVDPNTKYRYYSILQYEKLGTIKELRQLGMKLKEIKEYFDNRSSKKSLSMLVNKHSELKDKITKLQLLEISISQKINFLKSAIDESNTNNVVLKKFYDRKIFTFGKLMKNQIDLSYGFLELENSFEEIAPILASNRLGFIIPKENIESLKNTRENKIFGFYNGKTKVDRKYIRNIKGGVYACIYNNGKPWYREESVKKIIKYIKDNNLVVIGDALQVAKIDITVTDILEEECFEIQIPVKINDK